MIKQSLIKLKFHTHLSSLESLHKISPQKINKTPEVLKRLDQIRFSKGVFGYIVR